MEKVNYRVQNAKIKQRNDNNKSIPLNTEKEILDVWRCKAHQNFRPVERRQWNQIKSGQDDVDLRHIIEKLRRHTRRRKGQQPIQKKSDKRQYHVRYDPGGRDPYHPLAPVAQQVEIHRHRLCPAEAENKEHDGTHGVEVFEWIEA